MCAHAIAHACALICGGGNKHNSVTTSGHSRLVVTVTRPERPFTHKHLFESTCFHGTPFASQVMCELGMSICGWCRFTSNARARAAQNAYTNALDVRLRPVSLHVGDERGAAKLNAPCHKR